MSTHFQPQETDNEAADESQTILKGWYSVVSKADKVKSKAVAGLALTPKASISTPLTGSQITTTQRTLLTTTIPQQDIFEEQKNSPLVWKKKQRLVSRTDHLLEEWDPAHFRLFIGNLGNEVSDKTLTDIFSVYPSFVKALVVRDGRTNKTKGYGFASFEQSTDFLRAWKEWNGKYIGNRPCTITRSKALEGVNKKQFVSRSSNHHNVNKKVD